MGDIVEELANISSISDKPKDVRTNANDKIVTTSGQPKRLPREKKNIDEPYAFGKSNKKNSPEYSGQVSNQRMDISLVKAAPIVENAPYSKAGSFDGRQYISLVKAAPIAEIAPYSTAGSFDDRQNVSANTEAPVFVVDNDVISAEVSCMLQQRNIDKMTLTHGQLSVIVEAFIKKKSNEFYARYSDDYSV